MNDTELRERLNSFLNLPPHGLELETPTRVEDVAICLSIVDANPDFFTFAAPIGGGSCQLERHFGTYFFECGPIEFGEFWYVAGRDLGEVLDMVEGIAPDHSILDQMIRLWRVATEPL